MRRSGHPSRPRAMTCCFFASLKTLLISTKAKCLTPKSTSRASFSLAGFQVTLIGRFWVTPEDNGPGFPVDIGSRAFERFAKGKHSPGHGLGLAFVDAVVQAHGGAARISDRAGGGAVITLSLPVSILQTA